MVIVWDDYFMGIALMSSLRSKDPCVQVGACIVNEDNRIVGIGYNGFPRGVDDQEFPWSKNDDSLEETKYAYVCHAELNAVLNSTVHLKGCRIYCTLFPCHECTKVILQTGMKSVYYLAGDLSTSSSTASLRMMKSANIESIKMSSIKQKISKNLDDLNIKCIKEAKESKEEVQLSKVASSNLTTRQENRAKCREDTGYFAEWLREKLESLSIEPSE